MEEKSKSIHAQEYHDSVDSLLEEIAKKRRQVGANLYRGLEIEESLRDRIMHQFIEPGYKPIEKDGKVVGVSMCFVGRRKGDYDFVGHISVDIKDWLLFLASIPLNTVQARTPHGTGIPYKDGIWMGDVIFSGDPKFMKTFHIVGDIHTIEGNLIADTAETISSFSSLKVNGDVVLGYRMFKSELTSPLDVKGKVCVYGLRNIIDRGYGKKITPASLQSYGLRPGNELVFKNKNREHLYKFICTADIIRRLF